MPRGFPAIVGVVGPGRRASVRLAGVLGSFLLVVAVLAAAHRAGGCEPAHDAARHGSGAAAMLSMASGHTLASIDEVDQHTSAGVGVAAAVCACLFLAVGLSRLPRLGPVGRLHRLPERWVRHLVAAPDPPVPRLVAF